MKAANPSSMHGIQSRFVQMPERVESVAASSDNFSHFAESFGPATYVQSCSRRRCRPTFYMAFFMATTSRYSAYTKVVPSVAWLLVVHSRSKSSSNASWPSSSSEAIARFVGP